MHAAVAAMRASSSAQRLRRALLAWRVWAARAQSLKRLVALRLLGRYLRGGFCAWHDAAVRRQIRRMQRGMAEQLHVRQSSARVRSAVTSLVLCVAAGVAAGWLQK